MSQPAMTTVAGTPAEVVAHYRPLVAAGLRYFMVCVTTGDEETLRLLTEEVAPQLG